MLCFALVCLSSLSGQGKELGRMDPVLPEKALLSGKTDEPFPIDGPMVEPPKGSSVFLRIHFSEYEVYLNGWERLGLVLKPLMSNTETKGDHRLLVDYFTIQPLEKYLELFLPGESSEVTEKYFEKWRHSLSYGGNTVSEKFELIINNKNWCLFKYRGDFPNMVIPGKLLLKEKDKRWYPASLHDNQRFKNISGLLSKLRPEFLIALINSRKQPFEEVAEKKLSEVRNSVIISQDKIDGEKLLLIVDEILASKESDAQVFASTFLTPAVPFYKPVGPVTELDKVNHKALLDYLYSKGFSSANAEAVLVLIKQGAYLRAAGSIRKHDNSEDDSEYVAKIRELYGEDKIRTIRNEARQ